MSTTPHQARKQATRKKGPKSKATKFTHAKFCWLEQVARDNRNLPPLATAVCIELCDYLNLRYDGAARVWQDALAQALGARREAINKVIKALVERGHLSSTRCGRDQPNRYQMVLKDGARCAQERTSSAPMMCDHDVRKTRLRCAPQRTHTSFTPETSKEEVSQERERETVVLTHDDLTPGGGAAPLTGAPTEEVQEEGLAREERKEEGREQTVLAEPEAASEDTYAELRAAWPRERADRRAFEVACQEVAPDVIIEAARNWVAEADAPRFLKSLARWLAARGWEKQPPQRKARRTATAPKGRYNGRKRDIAAEFFKLGSQRHGLEAGAS